MTFWMGIYILGLLIVNCLSSALDDNTINGGDGQDNYYPEDTSRKPYKGENFPDKYLEPENVVPNATDFDLYLRSLKRTVDYFASMPNSTDVNKALGLYLMNALLQRTLHDDGDKLKKKQHEIISDLMKKAYTVLSHYIYLIKYHGTHSHEINFAPIFKDDSVQTYSIRKFNRNKLKKWIRSEVKLHEYVQAMDEGTLSKETYCGLIDNFSEYSINIYDSGFFSPDLCLSRLSRNPEPIDPKTLQPCLPDPYCIEATHTSPSVGYSLSHRLFNILMYRHNRRCYMINPKVDGRHMDLLCASMYRETVYLARRGYFYRDLFMEHVAICALLGYEEFHRRHWFHKVASWVDQQGCVKEFLNFELNRTRLFIEQTTDEALIQEARQIRNIVKDNECHNHQMALSVIVMAHAIRHTAHFMPLLINNI